MPDYSSGNVETDLRVLEKLMTSNGYNPIYVNLTRTDIEIPVVRTIVAGLDMPNGASERQFLHFLKQSGMRLPEHLSHSQ